MSTERAHEILHGDPAHCHANRRIASNFQPELVDAMADEDGGKFAIPEERRLRCFDYSSMSLETFEATVDTPCVLEGVAEAEQWPCAKRWSSQRDFCAENADITVPITELFAVHGLGKPQRLGVPLRHYVEYAQTNEVDFPYYPWEREFAGDRASWLETFWPPKRFFDEDAFDLSSEARTWFPYSTHRFVIIGGARCGACVHQDPKASGAWNHVLFGRKRWCFFPPDVPPSALWDGVCFPSDEGGNKADAAEGYRCCPSSYWWLDAFPRLRDRASELGMLEVIQRPGDTLYVPPGWWHAVFNIPDASKGEALTLCVTQNAVTPTMLRRCDFCRRAISAYPFAHELATLMRSAPRWGPELADLIDPKDAFERRNTCDSGGCREPKHTSSVPCHQKAATAVVTNTGDVDDVLAARRSVFVMRGETLGAAWTEVPRVAASELSQSVCRERFIRRGRPVVITGMGEALLGPTTPPALAEGASAAIDAAASTCPWAFLRDRFGGKRVCIVEQSDESRAENTLGKPDVGFLRDQLDAAQQGRSRSYLYDVSVPHTLPELLEWWRLPRYFAHDYLQQTMRHHACRGSWPTLFIGSPGTASTLHVDQWHGHFWMLQVAGTKRWKMWSPGDTVLLRPRWEGRRLDPMFPPLADLVGDAEVDGRCVTIDVHPGEVIFVPGGAPHTVENLDATIALAGNFVDDSNIDNVMADLATLSNASEAAASILEALQEIDFQPDVGMNPELLSAADLGVWYEDFASGAAASWRPSPQ
eukprot:TRINITY_DN35420_c0_g1_i1.p1 TRINITY_DN35420_c0_g1~~TRINITY_DN35420_c0_g1_i1.p1  ORF type:complete len:867 (-),score=124.46 TRINITY_DN35420_c0_g1_i1:412-2691(-)